jgi:prepilin-type N-terminal cleavage/methylation domain-containing protein
MKRTGGTEKSLRNRGGFTLMEVILALGIILVLSVGLAGIDPAALRNSWKARETALKIVSTLKRARWLAISENGEYSVLFRQRSRDKGWQAILRRKDFSWRAVESPIDLSTPWIRLTLTGSEVKEFNPDGTCSTGSIIISGPGGRTYRISLTPSTGRIRLYREG